MSRIDDITKYTCDICGKIECVKKGDEPPMQYYVLPMKYYSETGRECGLTKQGVDLCSECARNLEHDLSQYYDMCVVAYAGVRMERRLVNAGN